MFKKEDYVSLEVAKLLKEKGFEEPCKSSIFKNGELMFYDQNQSICNMTSIKGEEYLEFLCPTLYEAQKWLREKHDIHILTDYGMDGYDFAITRKDEDGLFIEESYHEYYETYEKCLDNAIRAALGYVIYSESLDEDNKCLYCNSYKDGWCTNFGKEVNAEDSCKFFQKDVIEFTCQHCGKIYEIIDSDASNKEKFCCKACEYGC